MQKLVLQVPLQPTYSLGYANGLARLGTVNGAPGQIPQENAILTATALTSAGAEVSEPLPAKQLLMPMAKQTN